MNNITKLFAFDFDGTLFQTFEPQVGKPMWEKYYNKKYPHVGWWSKSESLDVNVFDIKPYPSVLNELNDAVNDSNSYVIILTSRISKLTPYLSNVLDYNKITVDEVNAKKNNKHKGERILEYIDKFKDLNEINVYDDNHIDIDNYRSILYNVSNDIRFNIYLANDGILKLIDSNKNVNNVMVDEIMRILKK